MKLLTILTCSFLAFALQAAEIDTKKSTIKWEGAKKLVDSKHYGTIGIKSATMKEENGRIKNAEIVIDMNTLETEDLSGEYRTKFLTHMKSADFFEVEKFPTAKLVVEKDNGEALQGKLTIKGKTNAVKIPYQKVGNAYFGFVTFDRTKFDMKYGSDNFFKNLGDKVIKNEVKLGFNIVLKE